MTPAVSKKPGPLWAASLLATLLLGPVPARAENVPDPTRAHDANTSLPAAAALPSASATAKGTVHLVASLAADGPPLRAGVIWRVFDVAAQGGTKLVAETREAQPAVTLPNGVYMVHVAYGFASAMKQIVVSGDGGVDRMNLNAGGIEVTGMLGDRPITPDKLSLSIYVPERGNSEAKLVVAGAKPGQVIRLPEGMYHVVSTYLDTVGVGSLTPVTDTNSIISADLRVQAGKLVQATVRHSAAVLTLKLVNAPGGEALANTSFTILTPGGDIIRELIGAFPSLVLAEGDYLVIARHNGKTFQGDFKVQSALDRDVEVIAKSSQP